MSAGSSTKLKRFLPDGHQPAVAASAFVAPTAVLWGAVSVGEEASIWPGSVLRADINRIEIGPGSNVQDGCVLHVSDAEPCILGRDVSLGHRAVVHACEVGDGVLVGMGAIVMDGARIGAGSVIAAGALVPRGLQVPPGSLVMGMPARVVRALTAQEQQANLDLAAKYRELAYRFQHADPQVLAGHTRVS
jgi:carbonic anhydrase/acetyltransferase-like protein (isoleucine patch superfamily)